MSCILELARAYIIGPKYLQLLYCHDGKGLSIPSEKESVLAHCSARMCSPLDPITLGAAVSERPEGTLEGTESLSATTTKSAKVMTGKILYSPRV